MSKSLILAEISRILSSGNLFLSHQGQQEFLAELFLAEKQSWFFDDMPTYSEETSKIAKKLADDANIPLTVDYTDANLESEAIAYYRIKGMIMGESNWWFSTKQFNEDLKAAEANPMIMCHFLHINSGGGDTWYLDVAWRTMMDLKKPTIALIERVGASAAIYLCCPCKNIYAATQNETLGSIGCMVSFLDFIPYYESQGVKKIEEYASKSDLKNKKFNDLLKGGTHAQKFIDEELNPLQQQFESAVRKARSKAGALEDKHPLFRGETYATQAASDLGLIDGQKDLAAALQEAYNQGQQYVQKNRSAFRYLNSNFK
jgi:ClpP class serine protease